MNYILYDHQRQLLMPFTLSRPVCEIRVGMRTIKQKWENMLQTPVSIDTVDYLSKKYPKTTGTDNTFINAAVLPDMEVVSQIQNLAPGQELVQNGVRIACRTANSVLPAQTTNAISYEDKLSILTRVWDIFGMCDEQIRADFAYLSNARQSAVLNATNTLIGSSSDIFIEEGAIINCATFNTTTGPIYIGQNAQVMEGTMIRGPLALGENAVLKMGTRIYGATSIGPHCKVGGEISNSVFFGYSNKAHDGFVGNAVVGEWCNLGADTNNSNLKNNYGNVRVYDYATQKMIDTGLQFCGLFMGDHAKCAINTQFNTGTVVGFSSNVFGGDFPPKYIPDFSWGGSGGFVRFELKKAIELAENMFLRRGVKFTEVDKAIFHAIYSMYSLSET